MHDIKDGKITINTITREKPTPLAYHILMQYADTAELMAPERLLLTNIDRMKHSIDARVAKLLCMNCGKWTKQIRIKDLAEEPECENCHSRLLTLLYFSQDAEKLVEDLKKRREGKELTPEELKDLSNARRKADLILSYGKQAVRALQVKGVGPRQLHGFLERCILRKTNSTWTCLRRRFSICGQENSGTNRRLQGFNRQIRLSLA